MRSIRGICFAALGAGMLLAGFNFFSSSRELSSSGLVHQDPFLTNGGSVSISPKGLEGGLAIPACAAAGAVCGNGILESGEQCDNGGSNGACPAICSSSCTTNTCGGVCTPSSTQTCTLLESGQTCNGHQACNSSGTAWGSCVDDIPGDNCPASTTICGNGILESGEQCDNGGSNGACPAICSSSCTTNTCGSVCGNGVKEGTEQCDDAASTGNGACPLRCSSSCTLNTCGGSVCGNGVLESGEQCDTGASRGSCPATCSFSCTTNSCPTLGVSLSASPNSGTAPLATNLTANVTGTAVGIINYSFWWDCNSSATTVSGASSACGALPSDPGGGGCTINTVGAKCDGESSASMLVPHTYTSSGVYTPKVVVERSTAPSAESRASVNVSAPVQGIIAGYKITSDGNIFISPAYPGATITVSAGGGTYGPTVDPYITPGLNAGSYTVTSDIPTGYAVSYATCTNCDNAQFGAQPYINGNSITVTVPAGGGVTLWWKYTPLPGSLAGFIFYDFNGNGIMDAGEQALISKSGCGYPTQIILAGAVVSGVGPTNFSTEADKCLSNTAPYYRSPPLAPGIYTLSITPPAGWVIAALPPSQLATVKPGVDQLVSDADSVWFGIVPASGLAASCPSPGSTANLSWNSMPEADLYAVWVDNNGDGNPCTGSPGETCQWVGPSPTTFTAVTTPGSTNRFGVWVHKSDGVMRFLGWTPFTCPITPSLSVDLSANPNSGTSPLNSTLRADATTNQSGTFNYSFWWSCADTTTDLAAAMATCGDPSASAVGAKFNGVAAASQSVAHAYTANATPKVIVQQAALSAQDQDTVTIQKPPSPTGVVATVQCNASTADIRISWNDVPGEDGYRIFRSQTAGVRGTNISGVLPADTTTYLDAGVPISATPYFYTVRAFKVGVGGSDSVQVSADASCSGGPVRYQLKSNVKAATIIWPFPNQGTRRSSSVKITVDPQAGFAGTVALSVKKIVDIADPSISLAQIPGVTMNMSDTSLTSLTYATGSLFTANVTSSNTIPKDQQVGEYQITIEGTSAGSSPVQIVITLMIIDPQFGR